MKKLLHRLGFYYWKKYKDLDGWHDLVSTRWLEIRTSLFSNAKWVKPGIVWFPSTKEIWTPCFMIGLRNHEARSRKKRI